MKACQQLPRVLILLVLVSSFTQADDHQVTVPVSLNDREGQKWVVTFLKPTVGPVSRGPGGVSYVLTQQSDGAYRLQIDCDGNGNFGNDEVFSIKPGSTVCAWVRRLSTGQARRLPYEIEYTAVKDGDEFAWKPRYRLEGVLRFGTCQASLVVFDTNGDGVFDRKDFPPVTSVGIDRDADGKLWGKEEWLKGEQVIPFCGASFLIERIDPGGGSLTFLETTLELPRIGSRVPVFELVTLDGSKIQSTEFHGKFFLLDFWASWCIPCVKQFPELKALGQLFKESLSVVSVNVDDADRTAAAKKIIADQQLSWLQVVNGMGQQDPLWRMFGSDGRFVIPLYSVIDPEGTVVYIGNSLKEAEAILTTRAQKTAQ